jgi:hypothetical protein
MGILGLEDAGVQTQGLAFLSQNSAFPCLSVTVSQKEVLLR